MIEDIFRKLLPIEPAAPEINTILLLKVFLSFKSFTYFKSINF